MRDLLPPVVAEGLQQLGLQLNDKQIEQFLHYQHELLDWNTRMNLTAITVPDEVWVKHFLDSLTLLSVYHAPDAHLLDIGSGAGFPGVPLKIVRPRWRVTLLEATGKKVTFLRHLLEVLALDDVEVLHGRAEEVAHQEAYQSQFDVVTARAVSSLASLLEYCAPYARVGGTIVLPKKGELKEELSRGKRAAAVVGARLQEDAPVSLPGLNDGRRLLVWKQMRPCPLQYPRPSAAMAKKPLG